MNVPAMFVLLLALPGCILNAPVVRVPPRQPIVLDNVTVINPTRGRQAQQRVSIQAKRIEDIRDSERDATGPYAGMYVLPGIVDMHTHYPSKFAVGALESTSLLFLAYGVTTIRDTGAALGRDLAETRARILAGDFPGPRMFFCGPPIDGDPPTHPLTKSVSTAAEAVALVDKLATEVGVDCIKVYHRLPIESLRAVREAATRHGLTLVGHVPADVSLADSMLDDSQHLYGIGEAEDVKSFGDTWGGWAQLDDEQMAEVIRVSLEHGIAHTPTLVIFLKLSRLRALSQVKDNVPSALPLFYADVAWDPDKGFAAMLDLKDEELAELAAALPQMRKLVGRMYEAGVELHLGTDSFMPYVAPGQAIAEEFAEFVAAGIPLEHVWAIATRGAGEALGVPKLGSVVSGAPADLLVFREDPTVDLAALATLELVIADGRVYSRADLDQALARHAAFVRSWKYRSLVHPVIRAIWAFLRW